MRRHKPEIAIGLLVLALFVMGLVIIYAIGPRVAQTYNGANGTNMDSMYYFRRYATAVGLAIVALVLGYKLPFHLQQGLAKGIIVTGIVLCVLLSALAAMNSGVASCSLGACRAFKLGSVSFQPAEILKIGILFYASWLIADRNKAGKMDEKELWVPVGALFVASAILVGWWQKDLGTTAVIFSMLLAMLLVAGVRLRYFVYLLLGMVLLAGALIVIEPHRLERLASYSGDGDSYHIENALIGMGTGGALGVGLGNSIQASGYLPEAISDSIFPIIGEIWGFVGTMGVVLIFTVLLIKMLQVARRTENDSWALYTVGVFAWIFAHAILNIGGMTAIIPMKGITLPFLSYGGTSMLFVAFATGGVLQISGWARREEVEDESISSGRGQRRARNASYRGSA